MSAVGNEVWLEHGWGAAAQTTLLGLDAIGEALLRVANSGIEERGAIFTRKEVVEFILDLVGYTSDKPLYEQRILEPSFGQGDFLIPAIYRLLTAYFSQRGHQGDISNEIIDCVRAVELHENSYDGTRSTVGTLLSQFGISKEEGKILLNAWLIHSDFLLTELPFKFSLVVGNPPYVRQELIPDVLIREYRRRFQTIYDRADLYIPFIEKSLSLLVPEGSLGFICSDRWMKNKYGGPLRRFVAHGYHLKYYIDMVDTQAFQSEVMAYPAITIITKEQSGVTRIAHRPSIDSANLTSLASELVNSTMGNQSVTEVVDVVAGSEPWILHSFDQLALVRRLEDSFPTIEETGCTIGIGVATGADKVFIAPYEDLNVETDRKIPLVKTDDIRGGTVLWRGRGIINPFKESGQLVCLSDYPKLAAYLTKNEKVLRGRHVAIRSQDSWYRTIDRIYPGLMVRPKLLIPDIKRNAQVVYEDGRFYPHHNLYYIISDIWNLRALQAVLMSGIARLFVSIYSTRMRGGYLRFQAQYLRRIRLPRWEDVSDAIKSELIDAALRGDINACNVATFKLYGLSPQERSAIGGNGE